MQAEHQPYQGLNLPLLPCDSKDLVPNLLQRTLSELGIILLSEAFMLLLTGCRQDSCNCCPCLSQSKRPQCSSTQPEPELLRELLVHA